ncbi:MAG: lipopolysaccharide biosynthesis protein RfbH [Methanomassiliicoccaceae archaeon]|jgi:CDP-6-deoxy-D-xylo-4-hexulose-3-dehydrase|nr:lipopolysaccharide biosynthesis protein RfbH [Methanomassiliicoccaceae archaeon]
MEKEQILEMVKKYYREKHVRPPYKGGDRINYAGRIYDEKEMCNLVDSSLDFWLTAGKYTEAFEKGLGKFLGTDHVSAVNSGSSANLLAFMTLTSPLLGERTVKRGDEIICVAAAFPTSVSPIVQYGAVPVFIDIELPSYNINISRLDAALSDKTKAVFMAHTLGNPFDIGSIQKFCDKNGLWLIEDNCDALGAEYTMNGKTRKTGTIGDIGTSSFYPAHQMTMGEGGAVYTNDPLLHKIIRSMRDWGRDCVCSGGEDNHCGQRFMGQHGTLPFGYDHKYVYSHNGYNLKVTDMQAAIGVAQLEKLPIFVERRRANWDRLRKNLECVSDSIILPEKQENSDPCWFGFIMTAKKKNSRNKIVAHLEKHNIQTRNLFAGNIIRHPCFSNLINGKDYRIVGDLKMTDEVMNNSFWVGVYPGMTNEMLDEMVRRIKEAVNL